MTRIASRFCSSFLFTLVLTGACTDDATPEYTDDEELDLDGKADGYAHGTASLRGTIVKLDTMPNDGVQICADRLDIHLESVGDSPVCTTTAADGTYRLELRRFTRYEIFLTKAGQVPMATLFRTGFLATELFATMLDENIVPLMFQLAGATYDPTKGFVTANAYTRDVEDGTEPPPGPGTTHVLPGISFEMPGTGVAPVYLGANGLPDPTLTATTVAGLGIFGNVTPGDHDARISAKPENLFCAREHRPRGLTPGSTRVRVRPGTHQGFWFRCIEL